MEVSNAVLVQAFLQATSVRVCCLEERQRNGLFEQRAPTEMNSMPCLLTHHSCLRCTMLIQNSPLGNFRPRIRV
ncbi:hypothetical protein BDW66DRAFT_125340 [Aspergillus desertorum]